MYKIYWLNKHQTPDYTYAIKTELEKKIASIIRLGGEVMKVTFQ